MNGSVFGAVKTSGELSAVIMPPTFMESVEEKNICFHRFDCFAECIRRS